MRVSPFSKHKLSGDSFGNDTIFICTNEGTFLIRGEKLIERQPFNPLLNTCLKTYSEDQSYQMVFDKSFCVRQISVVEDYGILLIRGGSSAHKDSHRIHVFKLNEFKTDQLKLRTKVDIRDRRIEKTRGCHLYTISKGGDGHLRLAVAVGRKMVTFQWKYSAAWTSWCSNNETETADGFIFLRVRI